MSRYKLDREEKELLASVERGEWRPVALSAAERRRYVEAARHTLLKSKRINIRLSPMDLEGIQLKAAREGVPYQTLITSVLHRYVTGQSFRGVVS